MEPALVQQLQRALRAEAAQRQGDSPLLSDLCEGLAEGPSPGTVALFSRYYRILSAAAPNVGALLGALHHAALGGSAPALAALFPSCGGAFRAGSDRHLLLQAVEAALSDQREELLEFILTFEPRVDDPRPALLYLLGAMAATERFGGSVSLVELGAGGGVRLIPDRYAFRIGAVALGESSLVIRTSLGGNSQGIERLLQGSMPPLAARLGLEDSPRDLCDPEVLRVSEAFLPPDRPELVAELRTAAALLAADPRPRVRSGDLARTLVQAYNEMAPGTTLLLCEALHWSGLSEPDRLATARAVQSLAAQIQPHKPIAWVQADRFNPGSARLELRMHTFGWADPEDRAVRRLAEAAPDLSVVRWLE